ncbi:MAG: signal peptidase I [Deltaproteobacteria bacterium]|nr:signal peptidase I [Deltaproteobacteria bacterium]
MPVLFVLTFRAFIAEAYVIPSGSMEGTLLVGDHVGVDKTAFGLRLPFSTFWLLRGRAPLHGEVVVFYGVEHPQRVLIKRVIGVGGDKVDMRRGRLFVNGRALRREVVGAPCVITLEGERKPDLERRCHTHREWAGGAKKSYRIQRLEHAHGADFQLRVPTGQLFLMGDNRDLSHDSRAFGLVPEAHLLGRARAVLWSWQGWKPRWERFFSALR